jgi:para-aminobenzoate synthetase / 4-amino-4-deoxychorismate lyase
MNPFSLNPDSILLQDHRLLPDRQQWLYFSQPVAIHIARSPDTVLSLLETIQTEVAQQNLYAAGFISYEAAPGFDAAFVTQTGDRFPHAWFGLYRPPEIVQLPKQTEPVIDLEWQADISPAEYQAAIARIKDYIHQGLTYQVNYSFRLQAELPASFDPWTYFLQLTQAQDGYYGAWINLPDYAICCASPELFFRWQDGILDCRPMKGTVQRGLSYEGDRQQSTWLQQSPKNQAENLMIVDMIRNDLGRIAKIGSVKVTDLFATEQYPTLWQMTSTVTAETCMDLSEIMRSLFPCASITGAPKASTMGIIAELEHRPRQIYTGTIGYIAPDRRAQFNVAIRTVLIDKRQQTAEYGVGGGIVWDSESQDEYEECCTKAKILTQPSPSFDLLETLLWTPESGYYLLASHLERLQQSADYFAIPIHLSQIQTALAALTAADVKPQKVRLLVSQSGEVQLSSEELISHPSAPVRLAIAPFPVDSSYQFLYHKTTQRQVYQQAYQQSKMIHPDIDDVLLWNERGEVTESSIANVIVELDGQWYTPPVTCGLLPGTLRRSLLEQGKVQERVILISDLEHAKIWLVNSVRYIRLAVLNCKITG